MLQEKKLIIHILKRCLTLKKIHSNEINQKKIILRIK